MRTPPLATDPTPSDGSTSPDRSAPETTTRRRLLIVEDEALIALDLERRLMRFGYDVIGVTDTGEEALALFEEHRPDIVLMDIAIFGPMDGVQAAHQMRRIADVPVVFLSAFADAETLKRASLASPYGRVTKPFDEHTLLATLDQALRSHARDVSSVAPAPVG